MSEAFYLSSLGLPCGEGLSRILGCTGGSHANRARLDLSLSLFSCVIRLVGGGSTVSFVPSPSFREPQDCV